MAAVTLPTVVAMGPFGPPLRPSQKSQYPEMGPGGRYVPVDQMPNWALASTLDAEARAAMLSTDRAWSARARRLAAVVLSPAVIMTSMLPLAAAGFAVALPRCAAMRRLLALPAAALGAFALANALAPYL